MVSFKKVEYSSVSSPYDPAYTPVITDFRMLQALAKEAVVKPGPYNPQNEEFNVRLIKLAELAASAIDSKNSPVWTNEYGHSCLIPPEIDHLRVCKWLKLTIGEKAKKEKLMALQKKNGISITSVTHPLEDQLVRSINFLSSSVSFPPSRDLTTQHEASRCYGVYQAAAEIVEALRSAGLQLEVYLISPFAKDGKPRGEAYRELASRRVHGSTEDDREFARHYMVVPAALRINELCSELCKQFKFDSSDFFEWVVVAEKIITTHIGEDHHYRTQYEERIAQSISNCCRLSGNTLKLLEAAKKISGMSEERIFRAFGLYGEAFHLAQTLTREWELKAMLERDSAPEMNAGANTDEEKDVDSLRQASTSVPESNSNQSTLIARSQ